MAYDPQVEQQENRRALLQAYTSSTWANAGFLIALSITTFTEFQLFEKSSLPEFILYSLIFSTLAVSYLVFDTLTYWFSATETILRTSLDAQIKTTTNNDSLTALDKKYACETRRKLEAGTLTKVTAFRAKHSWWTRSSYNGLAAFLASLPISYVLCGRPDGWTIYWLCVVASLIGAGLETYLLLSAINERVLDPCAESSPHVNHP